MAVTGTTTVHDFVTDALRLAGIVAVDEAATADEMQAARRTLNRMVKAWQTKGFITFTYTDGSLALTTASEYTLDPVRPLRIQSARLKRSGLETPMQKLTRDEYDMLPNKAATGLPTNFYYERQSENARLRIWPVLAAANGEIIEYTYEREFEDIATTGDSLDFPAEWQEAALYSLASRLGDEYALNIPNIDAKAMMYMDEAMASEHIGSVYFHDPS